MNQLGVTRGCLRHDHLLHTPDMFVRAPLPGMERATAIVHAAPAIGAKFTQYSAQLEAGGKIDRTDLQRFVYVLDGAVEITGQELPSGAFAYSSDSLSASKAAHLLVIERPYLPLQGMKVPSKFSGVSSTVPSQPLLGDPGVRVQPLVPDNPQFDFAVNLMTFDPGASLPMVESHVMEHGLLMINGGGIYRLGECWHPVMSGDFIWMAPFCPQWFVAVGKTPAQYIIYKDWNRHPHV